MIATKTKKVEILRQPEKPWESTLLVAVPSATTIDFIVLILVSFTPTIALPNQKKEVAPCNIINAKCELLNLDRDILV
jgi:hypothetical protein